MQERIRPKRLTRSPRTRLLAATALASGALVTGCGGGSGSPGVATLGGATHAGSSGVAGGGAASSGSSAPSRAQFEKDEIKFAQCMRANGVPNFPDPKAGGGFRVAFPINGPASSMFNAAQAKCGKLLPGFGAGPGSGPPPSAQTLAHWVKVAQCMRQHGIPNFPDPATTVPNHPPGGGVISDRDGVILVFPSTIDMQSPSFTRAATACGFRLTNH